MSLAKQRLDCLGGEVAMACADIDNERIGRGRRAGQGLAQSGIDGLSNHVFNNSSMGRGCSNSHNMHSFDRFQVGVNKYLAESLKIYQIVA